MLVDEAILKRFIIEEIDSDANLFNSLFGYFSGYYHEYKKLGFQGSDENLASIGRLAHKIKSNCKSFGAMELADLFQEIEDSVKKNKAEKIKKLYEKSVLSMKEVVNELKTVSAKYLLNGAKCA